MDILFFVLKIVVLLLMCHVLFRMLAYFRYQMTWHEGVYQGASQQSQRGYCHQKFREQQGTEFILLQLLFQCDMHHQISSRMPFLPN